MLVKIHEDDVHIKVHSITMVLSDSE